VGSFRVKEEKSKGLIGRHTKRRPELPFATKKPVKKEWRAYKEEKVGKGGEEGKQENLLLPGRTTGTLKGKRPMEFGGPLAKSSRRSFWSNYGKFS